MEAEARYTFVGAAVLLLLAALAAGLIWLRDIGRQGDYVRYAIHFERQALDGLEIGAEVNLRGIKVGRVEDYALSREKFNRVRVVVRIDRRTPVRINTEAVVVRNFVTGIAAIALVNREAQGEPLTAVPAGERYPVIAEGQSNLEEIAGRVNQVGEQVSQALTNVNKLLTAENSAAVSTTLRNLRDLSVGLNQRLAALDRTLERTAGAAASVSKAAGQLGGAGERAASVLDDTGQRLGATLAQAEQTLAEARGALGRIGLAADALQRQAGSTGGRLEKSAQQLEEQLSAAVLELRLGIDSAAHVLEQLRDPRAAFFGPGKAQLGPGEALP